MLSSSFSPWWIPGKRWPHTSSRASSWWCLCECLSIPGHDREHWVTCEFPMNHISFCPSHQLPFWEFSWLMTPGFSFLGSSLAFYLMPVLPCSLVSLWHMHAFQCHLQSLSVPFEHSPRQRGEWGRLEWYHSWKTSKRQKMSMNSRLFSGSLNSTYVLVPNVIHKIFWTFRVAKPIGIQSWTRRIRWNTAAGGPMSLCPLQSWSFLAKLCE